VRRGLTWGDGEWRGGRGGGGGGGGGGEGEGTGRDASTAYVWNNLPDDLKNTRSL